MKSILLIVLLVTGAAHAGAQEISARAAAPREGTVSIRTQSGSVRVVGWERGEVAVSGDDRARVSSGGGVTRVQPSGGHQGLEVRVPAGSRVEVSTQSGSIHVSGVSGAVDLQSTSGDFRVSGSPRMVSIEGLSGNTEMLGSTETLRVQTVSGGISVPRAQGFLELSTVSGSVRIASQGVRRATVRNVSGHTEFSGVVPRNASLYFENTSGSAELRVPAGVSARFDLSSLGSGRIENEFGPAARRRDPDSTAESVRFTRGAGGAEVTARTVSGTIRLRRQ